MGELYEEDITLWSERQGALLRRRASGELVNEAELDWINIAEEIESMGRAEQEQLTSRLAVLLAHLLKWRFQPERRGKSWRLTILEQRRRAERLISRNPSLRPRLQEVMAEAYGDAVLIAGRETKGAEAAFPQTCPWTFDDAMRGDFQSWTS